MSGLVFGPGRRGAPHHAAVSPHRVILLQPQAPPKPEPGQACNGCGLCCAAEPCPLGALVSRKLSGACAALEWQVEDARYRCGIVASPRRWLPWLPGALTRRLALRWIAAAAGCDSHLQPV